MRVCKYFRWDNTIHNNADNESRDPLPWELFYQKKLFNFLSKSKILVLNISFLNMKMDDKFFEECRYLQRNC